MDGIIIIDKPAGPTSADVVRRIKSRLGKRIRVGHLGTLDPFATGVLPILVGEGTKLAPFLQDGEKEYAGLIALGTETDTLDRTGEAVRSAPVPPLDTARLSEIAARFTGEIEQTPPIFSAIKRDGVRMYKLARLGGEIEPPASRRVKIMRLELAAEGETSIRFTVACSSGMYVRSLARDIGEALGTAAHLAELRRVRNGGFAIAGAHPLDEVMAALDAGGDPGLIGLRDAVPGVPEVEIGPVLERRLRNGDARALDHLPPSGAAIFKVVSGGGLVAIAETTSRVTASIARVFGAAE
jgi:tRNA pseudouridine55 synthase